MKIFDQEWEHFFQEQFRRDYWKPLMKFLSDESKTQRIYPPKDQWFAAFEKTPYRNVKVVILGQDPYHGKGQANGLAFSVARGEKIPPSLRNIYKELQRDLGVLPPPHGDLTAWAEQGVLLLNAVLTVRAGEADSHAQKGWELFTDAAISYLNQREQPMAFLLWGNRAQQKATLLTNPRHLVLKAAHPSPLAANRGFFGCGHFSAVRQFLAENGMTIDFSIK